MVQMWTPLQVFSNGYVYTDKFQLPLYNGVPNKVMSGVHIIFYYEPIIMCVIIILTRDTLASYIATCMVKHCRDGMACIYKGSPFGKFCT